MTRRWGDHRDWPDVPERQRAMLLADAQHQVELLGQTWIDRLGVIAEVDLDGVVEGLSGWAQSTVNLAAHHGESSTHTKARHLLVRWGTSPGDRFPSERWWWSPCGLLVTAWSEPGWWEVRSNGLVRQYVTAGEVARHLPVSARTVRRWGENRKRVRQRGTVADDRTRRLHRTDLAQLVVMRYSLVMR